MKEYREDSETHLRAQEAREDVADLVDFGDDPRLGLVGGELVLNPGNQEEANYGNILVSNTGHGGAKRATQEDSVRAKRTIADETVRHFRGLSSHGGRAHSKNNHKGNQECNLLHDCGGGE